MSKLVRAVEDAITSAGVWIDDSYVCTSYIQKRYAEPGEQTGCHIKVIPITDHRSDNEHKCH